MAVLSLPMGLNRKPKSVLAGLSFLIAYVIVRRQQTRAKRRARQQRVGASSSSSSGEKGRDGSLKPRKVGVDKHFVEQLKKLLPICIPGFASKEAGLLAALATILIAR